MPGIYILQWMNAIFSRRLSIFFFFSSFSITTWRCTFTGCEAASCEDVVWVWANRGDEPLMICGDVSLSASKSFLYSVLQWENNCVYCGHEQQLSIIFRHVTGEHVSNCTTKPSWIVTGTNCELLKQACVWSSLFCVVEWYVTGLRPGWQCQ